MKVWYEHPYGRLDRYDMQWVKVFAEVEPEEQEQALAQGFIDVGKHWLQVRSSRINIKEYIKTANKYKQRKGVSVEKWTGTFALKHQNLLQDVYDRFLAYNKFHDSYPFSNAEISDKETFYCYYYEDRLVAWSVWTKYGHSIDNWQYAWDYANPSLHLGRYSMDHEIRTAYDKGYNWFYLGASYDKSCEYKCKIPGFQWWTGKEWSTDIGLYLMHIKADNFVEDLSDLENVYKGVYGLHKPPIS